MRAKRHVGGTARDVWTFAAGSDEAVELTGDYAGESHSPMWWNGRVYFVTDRDGTMNIWSMQADGGDLRQHTEHAGWDVRDPDLSAGRVVYQLGADLWTYDVAAAEAEIVPITLASDFEQLREKWETETVQYLTSAHLHPQGESVVLTARGRVFVAPAGNGRLLQATRGEGVRYRDVVFIPPSAPAARKQRAGSLSSRSPTATRHLQRPRRTTGCRDRLPAPEDRERAAARPRPATLPEQGVRVPLGARGGG